MCCEPCTSSRWSWCGGFVCVCSRTEGLSLRCGGNPHFKWANPMTTHVANSLHVYVCVWIFIFFLSFCLRRTIHTLQQIQLLHTQQTTRTHNAPCSRLFELKHEFVEFRGSVLERDLEAKPLHGGHKFLEATSTRQIPNHLQNFFFVMLCATTGRYISLPLPAPLNGRKSHHKSS